MRQNQAENLYMLWSDNSPDVKLLLDSLLGADWASIWWFTAYGVNYIWLLDSNGQQDKASTFTLNLTFMTFLNNIVADNEDNG